MHDAAQPFLSQVMLSTPTRAAAVLMTRVSMLWTSNYVHLLRVTTVRSIFAYLFGITTIYSIYIVISPARAKYMALAVSLFIWVVVPTLVRTLVADVGASAIYLLFLTIPLVDEFLLFKKPRV